MSDEKQLRFYQISATGGQLLFAFFAALVLLAAAFFFGFRSGRAVPPGEVPALPATAVTAAPSPAEGSSSETVPGPEAGAPETSSEPPAELGQIEPAVPESASSAAATVLPPPAEPRSAASVAPAAAKSEPAPKKDVKSAATAPTSRPEPEAKSGKKGSAAPAPPAPATAAASAARPGEKGKASLAKGIPKPGSAATAPSAASPKGWTVQVMALESHAKADEIRKKLGKRYTTVDLVEISSGGKKRFAIRIGHFAAKEEADRMATKLLKNDRDVVKEARVVAR